MAAMTPEQIKKTFAKARAAQEAGNLSVAAKGYQRILSASPNLPEVHYNLGEIAARQGRVAEAAQSFEAALKLRPGEAAIWLAYLNLAARHPRVDNLKALLNRVGSNLDRLPEMDFFRGLVVGRENPADAVELFRSALKKGARTPRLHTELGLALEKMGEGDAALEAFDAAIAVKPDNDLALSRKADLLRNMGRFEEAREVARAAIEAMPRAGPLYYSYASIAKMQPDDPLIAKMRTLFSRMSKSDPGRPALGFALSKTMEDIGASDEVFAFLNAANRSLSKTSPYDIDSDREAVQVICALFEAQLRNLPVPEEKISGPTPIFVTGLPRSGTTLIEQVLASHSQVSGGGELGLLGGPLSRFLDEASRTEMEAPALQSGLRQVGETYRAALQTRFSDSPCVTDKSISTYASLGIIRHALPDARFIVVRRAPADNALSIYKNFFSEGTHRYSNDLADIARFMRLFEDQVAYWRREAPDAFIEVSYEDLVGDLEGQARRLVGHCGLAWEEACLNFHQNKRKVDTLSTTQVRKPIYASSIGGWKRYEQEMQPFRDAYHALGGQT